VGFVQEIEIPRGVEVKMDGNTIEVSGPKGKLVKRFDLHGIEVKMEDGRVSISTPSPKRRMKAMVGTIRAHLRNAFKGVTEGFTYKLKVVYSHFPISVKVEGDRVFIHNFLGEKTPRVARVMEGTRVEVRGDEVVVEGIDKEKVGQTALNIEQATRVRGKDRRVFQDGCYLFEKG